VHASLFLCSCSSSLSLFSFACEVVEMVVYLICDLLVMRTAETIDVVLLAIGVVYCVLVVNYCG
jgi:hypothetical protein